MAQWKKKASKHYGKKCVKCGSKENITIHHLLPLSLYRNQRAKMYNLRPLCKFCHAEYHDEYLKGNIELCNPDTFDAWLHDEIHPSLLIDTYDHDDIVHFVIMKYMEFDAKGEL